MLKTQISTRKSLSQRIWVVGGTIALLALFAVLYTVQTQEMSDLHWEPVCSTCSSDFVKYKLDWSDPAYWSEGALDKNIDDVAGSGTEFKVKYSGKYNKLARMGTGNTPNIQTFFAGGDHDALSHYVNPGLSKSENIILSITVNPPIPAEFAFEVYHVNGNWYSGDKLKIYAQDVIDGTKIYPSFTATDNPSWEERGSGTIDAVVPGQTYADVAAGVNFSAPNLINKIIFEWSNCDLCGTGVHGFGLGDITFFSNSNSLPVEWGALAVSWQESQAQLDWETAQELNTDKFFVERSVDGQLFEKIGEIEAAGNSSESQQYSFTDMSAKFDAQSPLYYRIKQTDMDGAFSYSSILELAPNTNIPIELLVFPNPASDQVNFKLAGATQSDFDYQVLNSAGQLMESGRLQSATEIGFEVSSWPAGNYHVKFANNTQQVSKSFQVIH